jgi:hypothetical protein
LLFLNGLTALKGLPDCVIPARTSLSGWQAGLPDCVIQAGRIGCGNLRRDGAAAVVQT